MSEDKKNNAIDSTGRKKTIDDFKGTKAYETYRNLNEAAAKARKGRSFFAVSGFKK